MRHTVGMILFDVPLCDIIIIDCKHTNGPAC